MLAPHNDEGWLDFHHVVTVPLTAGDVALGATNRSYGLWSGASVDAEGEWRRSHDREAFETEVARADAERDAKLDAERLQYEARLKDLTWDILLNESPFERWNRHPAFPSLEFVNAARRPIRQAIFDLRALSGNPRRADVRAVLKGCVQWFNTQDKVFGGVIETEEREEHLSRFAGIVRRTSTPKSRATD